MTTVTRTSNRSTAAQVLIALAAALALVCLMALALMAWGARSARNAERRVETEECLRVAGLTADPYDSARCIDRARALAR